MSAWPSLEGHDTEGARGFPVTSVASLCEFVDDLDPPAVGQLVVEGDDQATGHQAGAVFVEDGRICWAAASGLSRRLTQLLVGSASASASAMEEHFRACKARGVPLGEHLVREGIVSAPHLRDALAVHTAESLTTLCRPGARASWFPRAGAGYNARFTFTSAELLSRALAPLHPELTAELTVELEECFREGEWAVAFARSAASASPDPIAIRGPWPSSAKMLGRIGAWASSALDVAAIVHGEAPLLVVALPGGASLQPCSRAESLVAFGHVSGGMVVGETGAHGPARILNRRAALKRART